MKYTRYEKIKYDITSIYNLYIKLYMYFHVLITFINFKLTDRLEYREASLTQMVAVW